MHPEMAKRRPRKAEPAMNPEQVQQANDGKWMQSSICERHVRFVQSCTWVDMSYSFTFSRQQHRPGIKVATGGELERGTLHKVACIPNPKLPHLKALYRLSIDFPLLVWPLPASFPWPGVGAEVPTGGCGCR